MTPIGSNTQKLVDLFNQTEKPTSAIIKYAEKSGPQKDILSICFGQVVLQCANETKAVNVAVELIQRTPVTFTLGDQCIPPNQVFKNPQHVARIIDALYQRHLQEIPKNQDHSKTYPTSTRTDLDTFLKQLHGGPAFRKAASKAFDLPYWGLAEMAERMAYKLSGSVNWDFLSRSLANTYDWSLIHDHVIPLMQRKIDPCIRYLALTILCDKRGILFEQTQQEEALPFTTQRNAVMQAIFHHVWKQNGDQAREIAIKYPDILPKNSIPKPVVPEKSAQPKWLSYLVDAAIYFMRYTGLIYRFNLFINPKFKHLYHKARKDYPDILSHFLDYKKGTLEALDLAVAINDTEIFDKLFAQDDDNASKRYRYDLRSMFIADALPYHIKRKDFEQMHKIVNTFAEASENPNRMKSHILFALLERQLVDKNVDGIVDMIKNTDVMLTDYPSDKGYFWPYRDKNACLEVLRAFYHRHLKLVPNSVKGTACRTYSTPIRDSLVKFMEDSHRGKFFVDCALDMFGIVMLKESLEDLEKRLNKGPPYIIDQEKLANGLYDAIDPLMVENLNRFGNDSIPNTIYHALLAGEYAWFDLLKKHDIFSNLRLDLGNNDSLRFVITSPGDLSHFACIMQRALEFLRKEGKIEKYIELSTRYPDLVKELKNKGRLPKIST